MSMIVTVLTNVGEFVGKLKSEDSSKVVLEDPRMLIHAEQGMGFAHGVCVTGETNPKEVSFYQGGIVFVTKTNEDIEKAYRQAVSGLLIP